MEVEKVDFKKLFPDKKVTQKKVLDFFDKKGFYIVLVLCITVIGVTAALVTTHNITSSKNYSNNENIISPEMLNGMMDEDDSSTYLSENELDIENAAEAAAKTTSETGKPSDAAVSPTPKPTEAPKDKESTKEQKATEPPKQEKKSQAKAESKAAAKTANNNEKAVQTFAMPVFGKVTLEYAMDKLVYSKTLEEWRSHSGVDIRADRGTAVKVVADGVVSEIKNDPRFGVTVIVEHANGIKTLYANLAGSDMVTPNQKVKQGEVIGSVGNTAIIESAEPPHLHFEVIKDGKPVDPGDYLSLSSEILNDN
jgi:murein DD-endopeptidase MepM/ murein hydrolase activator NlpD